VEGGERSGPLQVGLDVIVFFVQAPEDLENKGMVLHVLVDAHITLNEELKLCVKVEGTRLTVAEELLLEGNLELLSGAVTTTVTGVGGLLEVDGDGVEQP
jgi:hypothetical protein